ncbi:MAG TPA: hypothetical protein PLO89_00065 [Spirochaetota bacterium]|nr:hypothetical protein [Spirochaetota bacterium]
MKQKEREKRMIATITKDFIEKIVNEHTDIIRIARNRSDERMYLSDNALPFVSLITANGLFDERMAKEGVTYNKSIPTEFSYYDFQTILSKLDDGKKDLLNALYTLDESGNFYQMIEDISKEAKESLKGILGEFGYGKKHQCNIRGAAQLPIEVRVFSKSERESEEILKKICSNIPFQWTFEGVEGKIMIDKFGSSDWSDDIKDFNLSWALIDFYMDIISKSVEIPTIKASTMVGMGIGG